MNLCSKNKESLQCLSALFSHWTHVGGSESLGSPFWMVSWIYFHQCILKTWFPVSHGPDSGAGDLLIIPVLSIPKLCIFNWFFFFPAHTIQFNLQLRCYLQRKACPFPLVMLDVGKTCRAVVVSQRQPVYGSCRQKGAKPQPFAVVTVFVVNKAKCHLSSLPWAKRHFRGRAFKTQSCAVN